jgi:hypothetical protein
MSLTHGVNMVRDGLVLCLDARNPKSYPGTGNTWFDISGNNNHATLSDVGSKVSYNPLGYFQHTVTDYFGATTATEVSLDTGGGVWQIPHSSSISPNGSWTISGFMDIEGTQSNNGGGWLHKPGSGDERGVNVEVYSNILRANDSLSWTQNNIDISAWHNKFALYTFVFTQTSGVYGTDAGKFDFYINGELQNSSASFTPKIDGTSSIWLGRRQGHLKHFFKGKYTNFHFYKKALSQDEIKQNFEAIRGRFGI